MFDWIVTLIPALPWLASALLGFHILTGRISSEADEPRSAGLILSTISLSFLLACLALILAEYGLINRVITLGRWLDSGDFHVHLSLLAERQTLGATALFSGLILLTARFSVNYLHREAAYHRFFLILGLFAGAIPCLILGGNLVLTWLGWELAGVCSFLLIVHARQRPIAARHTTRAFLTHRVGDAGFGLAIFVAYTSGGSLEWAKILTDFPVRGQSLSGSLALCLLLPALAKSALIPFSPWLTRAIEGSTPSSALFYGAVMVSVGAFLVLRLEPLFMTAPWAMALMAAAGLVTLIYGYLCGLTQSDVKTALIFATISQTGLIFLLAGSGFWTWAWWYMAAHAVLRALQFLNAPSLMHHALHLPTLRPPAFLTRQRWLYRLSLQRFRLEDICDDVLVKPCLNLSRDCQHFDQEVIEKSLGWSGSALYELATLAQWEEERLGVRPKGQRSLGGLPAWIINTLGALLHWFEQQLVLRGLDQKILRGGKRLGQQLDRMEYALALPRYWLLWIILTLLILV